MLIIVGTKLENHVLKLKKWAINRLKRLRWIISVNKAWSIFFDIFD